MNSCAQFLGSVTLHKWHHLASENVVAGLNFGNVLPGNHNQIDNLELSPIDPTHCSSTLSNSDLVVDVKLNDLENDIFEDGDDDEDDGDYGLTLKADRTGAKAKNVVSQNSGKSKQSTPVQTNPRSMESIFANEQPPESRYNSSGLESAGLQSLKAIFPSSRQDRTIITRNSSILDSMRKARSMLNKDNGSAKSKANAIDILANAMNKANVEAKAGQRILESVANRNMQDRAATSPSKTDYQDMPKVNKVLERLASNKDSQKVSLNDFKTPLKLLVEKAAEKKSEPATKTELAAEKTNLFKETSSSNPTVLPALMAGPAGMRAATGMFGNIFQKGAASSGQTSLLSTVFSSNITAVGSEATKSKPALSRSWSSGDIKRLNNEDINALGPFDTNVATDGVGRARRNSIGAEAPPSLSNVTKSAFSGLGMIKRSNSSGSLSDLAKQDETNATSGSPPKVAPFISFDNYGVEDYSFGYGSSAATDTSKSVTTTTASVSQSTTTTTVTTGSKPTGFLRGLFLSSSSANNTSEVKRPSSVYEGDSGSSLGALGRGSASSVESGMNRFGKALAQEDFGGFGFGFMSYFSGSKNSKS